MARPITEGTVRHVAAQLGKDGWSFTARQLYYGVCALVETDQGLAARGELGCGALLLGAAAVAGRSSRVVAVVIALVGIVALATGVRSWWFDRIRAVIATGRGLVVSFDEFEARWLTPLRAGGFTPIAGLIPDLDSPSAAAVPLPDTVGDIIVCDRRDTAEMLRVNAKRAEIAIPVIDEASLSGSVRVTRAFVVHDADPPGCDLPTRLASRAAEIVDIAIRPSQFTPHDVAVIEGAPAIVSPGAQTILSRDEVMWLASGRRCEAMAFEPAMFCTAVARAISGDVQPVAPASSSNPAGEDGPAVLLVLCDLAPALQRDRG